MGLFLSTTALREVTVRDLVQEIEDWFSDHYIVCTEVTGGELPSAIDSLTVHAPHNGWTTVIWPTYFEQHSEVAGRLSERVRTVASSINVYHSETWQHVAYDNGTLIDEYATDPSYLVSGLDDPKAIARRWSGKPDAVASHLGGSAREIARHYRRNRKAHSFDDWGFTKVWAELGIEFPGDTLPVAATMTLPERWERAFWSPR